MSSSHFSSMFVTSAMNNAVGAKICRSAVQPRRSLRCGQSVGMLMKFARRLVTMFDCSLSTSVSEHDVLAGPTVDLHAQHARRVGAKIDDVAPRPHFSDGLSRKYVHHADAV